jgi:hypothetical protein
LDVGENARKATARRWGRVSAARHEFLFQKWQSGGGHKIAEAERKNTRDKTIAELLLEEIFEGLARIGWARRNGCFRLGGLRGLRISCRRGVFFDGHAKFVKCAGVLGVLGRDALGDGLRTLELRAGIEEAALLATVKLEIALGALAAGIETGGENGAAVGAACSGDGANHAGSARAEMIVGARAAGGRLFFMMRALFFVLLFGIAIAAMAILTVHVRLRLTVRAGGNCQ